MATPFQHKAKAMGASEVHRRRHVGAVSSQDGVFADPRCPGAGPAQSLGQGDAVTDEERIAQTLRQLRARRAGRAGRAGGKRRLHLYQPSPDRPAQPRPLGWVRPPGLAGTNPPKRSCGIGQCRCHKARPEWKDS